MRDRKLSAGPPGGGRRSYPSRSGTERRPATSPWQDTAPSGGTTRSVLWTSVVAAALFGLLVAASYPQTAAVITGVAIAGYVFSRALGRYIARSGLPMPGTSSRLRVFTDSRSADGGGSRDDRRSWSLTVALQKNQRN